MKNIFLLLASMSSLALSAQKKPAIHWYHGEPKKKNMGISLDKAYQSEYLKRASTAIVVAVIDGGTDVNHEDLKEVLWTNPKEIPGNGLDDDNNGYIDDVNGWNFIGGADGKMVGADNLEKARVLKKMMDFYEAEGAQFDASSPEYQNYLKLKGEVLSAQASSKAGLEQMEMVMTFLEEIKKSTGKEEPTADDLEKLKSDDEILAMVAKRLAKGMRKEGFTFSSLVGEMTQQYEYFDLKANIQNNPYYDSRTIVGDNYANSSERYYGNNNVVGPDASHGSHVAGIIAAKRGNGLGLDGVADNVKIMVVRVVPDGDERDKDVANGIRYAVDNGAKIINMSFGKGYSWDKNIVDSAVAYAEEKGVLLVHAAGNSAQNNDVEPNYPNDTLWGGQRFALNWIEVGASQPRKKKLATDFSNYGKNNVDIFAPGQDIYSSIPGDKYAYFNGTSMAAPVVSGVAALVWSRYPKLSAVQIKQILLESGTPVNCKVPIPGEKQKIKFSELSQTGKLINAFEALKLADKFGQNN
jgi:subtilisin family serine protease